MIPYSRFATPEVVGRRLLDDNIRIVSPADDYDTSNVSSVIAMKIVAPELKRSHVVHHQYVRIPSGKSSDPGANNLTKNAADGETTGTTTQSTINMSSLSKQSQRNNSTDTSIRWHENELLRISQSDGR